MQRPVSKVVIAGPKQAGKKSLLRGLFEIDGHTRPSDLELSSPVSWELRTRYYRAPLSVIVLSHEQFAEPGPAAREAFEGAEALIIVCDSAAGSEERATFLAEASAFADFAGLKAGCSNEGVASSFECLLLCSNKNDLAPDLGGENYGDEECVSEPSTLISAHDPSFVDSLQAWASDRGFEHINVCSISPRAGADSREKTGLPRVLEALQATMWASMVRETLLGEAAHSYPSYGDAGQITKSLTDRVSETQVGQLPEPDETSEVGVDVADEGDGPDFELLMQEMRRIKVHAQAGLMSDEQRREQAAQMTLRLMSLMGFDDA